MPGDTLSFDQSKASQLLGIGQCWAIEDGYACAALANLERLPVADCVRFAIEEREREREETSNAAGRKSRGEAEPKPYQMKGGTAILEVRGTMTKNRSSWGGASTKSLSDQLLFARDDADVQRILMLFETPGGDAKGCAEFADVIRMVNSVKPVYGYSEDMCASAGYFALSQCTGAYSNRMGMVGCIGTLLVIEDSSAQAAMMGIRMVKVTSSGAETYKGMGVEGTALTDVQLAHLQAMANHYGDDFKATVQTGRALSDEQIKAVAIGKMFTAQEALGLGLIDGICSLDECLSQISGEADPVSPTVKAGTEMEPVTGTIILSPASSTPAAKPANDPAKASQRPAKETQMTFKEIVGRLFGANPEALEKAGVTAEQLNAALAEDAQNADIVSVKAEFDRMKNMALHLRAERFWDMLITPDENGKALATWTQKDGVISTFKTLAKLDGPKFNDSTGELVIGPALDSYMSSLLGATPNALQKETIEGKAPAPVKGVGAVAEDVESVLGGTFLASQAEVLAHGGNK
jgi:signal peptide peptidase SppA